jgi:hypothetical protein
MLSANVLRANMLSVNMLSANMLSDVMLECFGAQMATVNSSIFPSLKINYKNKNKNFEKMLLHLLKALI